MALCVRARVLVAAGVAVGVAVSARPGRPRTVPLPLPCVDALREHLAQQQNERAEAESDWEDHGLVFPSRRGTPMEPDNLRPLWDLGWPR